MNILQIVPSYKPAYIYGGPIESVSKLCEGLAAAGNKVDVYTTTANGKEELPVKSGVVIDVSGVNVIYFKRQVKDPIHVSFGLWWHLWRNVKGYDIVNVQSWWNLLVVVATCICVVRGVKVVVSPRGMLSPYVLDSGHSTFKNLLHRTVGKWALSKAWLHATAQVEFEEFTNMLGDCKGFVAPNNVTLPELPITKQQNEVFTLIFMSRVHPKKGLEVLFEAISKLSFPVKLQIAGSGDTAYTNQLKNLTERLKIAGQIEWLGWIDRTEKFKVLMHADLFVLPSFNENFANVVVEALHMGTPVLVSKEVALSTFVNDNFLGWVCSLEVDNVVRNLAEAYADRQRRNWITENGRVIIENTFSEKILVRNYSEQYQKISKTYRKL